MNRILFTFLSLVIIVSARITSRQRKAVLYLHNKLRRDVAYGKVVDGLGVKQPSAGDMRMLRVGFCSLVVCSCSTKS